MRLKPVFCLSLFTLILSPVLTKAATHVVTHEQTTTSVSASKTEAADTASAHAAPDASATVKVPTHATVKSPAAKPVTNKNTANKKIQVSTDPQPSKQAFTNTINSQFTSWSAGGKTVTASSISSELTNPDVKGQNAAMVAAIAARINGLSIWDANTLPNINETLKQRGLPTFSSAQASATQDTTISNSAYTVTLVPTPHTHPQQYTVKVSFTQQQLLNDINNKNSAIYNNYVAALTNINQSTGQVGGYRIYGTSNALPPLTDVRQWKDGDCYLVSSVGALLVQNPAALQAMIKPIPGKTDMYDVYFPGDPSSPVQVSVTQAEIGMYSHSTEGGAWLAILSVAEAKVRDPNNTNPMAVIHGGTQTQVMQLLTGNPYQKWQLSGTQAQTKQLGELLSSVSTTPSETSASPYLENLNTPIGIETSAHALIIVGYNPQTGMVTIWNPWGTTTSYAPASGKTPFNMQNGLFNVPLSTLEQDGFVSLSIPTSMMPTA